METSLAEDVKKPTRTLSPDSFFFMSPYRSFTTSGCFRRFSQPVHQCLSHMFQSTG